MKAERRKEADNYRSQNLPVVSGTIESDNHADTWCFGPNFVMNHFTGQTCSVSGFN